MCVNLLNKPILWKKDFELGQNYVIIFLHFVYM